MAQYKRVTVGSRGSALTAVQNQEVLRLLRERNPHIEFVVVRISTDGDQHKNAPLLSMARGMFVKNIELALLNGEIDLAIHSAKDLPATLSDGLTLGAVGKRQDPRDILLNRWACHFRDLPSRARIGTSSPRRTAQLKAVRTDVDIVPIRGNIETRIEKSREDGYDGVILAAAGLIRMGWQDQISEFLSPEICIPEVGQGALAIETRSDDSKILAMLKDVNHTPTNKEVASEREFLKELGGGCTAPVTAFARLEGEELHISSMAALSDGSVIFRFQKTYDSAHPKSAGARAANGLLRTGASEIISIVTPP